MIKYPSLLIFCCPFDSRNSKIMIADCEILKRSISMFASCFGGQGWLYFHPRHSCHHDIMVLHVNIKTIFDLLHHLYGRFAVLPVVDY